MLWFCPHCNRYRPFYDFNSNNKHRFGLSTYCKNCSRALNRFYHRTNSEAISNRKRTYYASEEVRIRKSAREYYCVNGENVRRRHREWCERNRDHTRQYSRDYYRENRDKGLNRVNKYRKTTRGRAAQKAADSLRRARCKDTDITVAFLERLCNAHNRCPLCGEWRPNHLDHVIPLAVGGTHTKDNVRFLCARCNQSRPKDGSDLNKDVMMDG